MKDFLTDDFLLQTKPAIKLYHDYAAKMPIFDYHCHLPVQDIAENRQFENMTQICLAGDHYKWRAMRAAGVPERLITGNATDKEKFAAWAQTVPKTLRNPLYHWTHLELKNPFGITDRLLNSESCDEIYKRCNALLQSDGFSTVGILKKMNVKVVCTTDDPLDPLDHHRSIKANPDIDTRILPAFRPDKAMKVDDLVGFNKWVDRLAELENSDLENFERFMAALENRLAYFHQEGCRLSDHGIDVFHFEHASQDELDTIYDKARRHIQLEPLEIARFKSQVLIGLCRLYADHHWVQQFHIGPIRNTNTRMVRKLGPDTGYDSMGDHSYAIPLSKFLDTLDQDNRLAKTIIYTVNPKDNDMLAAMIGNFQDGETPGKMQFGSGWWFNDQKDGMEKQLNALSNMGLLSQFVGMLTDSRSFLSFPRHEYFRRILCNLCGNDVEKGELPHDLELIGGMIQDICFYNAERYFL
ncbi:MAG: glucuronate isomerase [bacterium]